MIITLCGSMKFINEMKKMSQELEKQGHTIYRPDDKPNDYTNFKEQGNIQGITKLKNKLMHQHFDKIRQSDAVLVCNYEKN